MLYSVFGVNSQSGHGEIQRDDLTSCSLVMAELRTGKKEMREDGSNDHEKLGLKRIFCARQFIIPNTAGMSPDPAWNNTDTRCLQSNQASRTRDYSYPLVSSTLSSSSSPSLSFSSTTQPSSQNT